jgi:hypothetical protein
MCILCAYPLAIQLSILETMNPKSQFLDFFPYAFTPKVKVNLKNFKGFSSGKHQKYYYISISQILT